MIRALVVADSGIAMSAVTAKLCRIDALDIVAYASGRARVDHVARLVAPDVVLVDEMCWPGLALARIAEVRSVAPLAAVIGLTSRTDGEWTAAGLQAGASAVIPSDLSRETLELVLREVLEARGRAPEAVRMDERSAA